jgi:hypothetical protein
MKKQFMVAYKRLTKILLMTLPLGGVIFFSLTTILAKPVLFESIESKTIEDHNVYNQVTFESKNNHDIWKMKQNHHGRAYPLQQWDDLMIKVDKSSRPYKVSYHQLQNGKEVEFKVSCYFCHSNGPRAIRANYQSTQAPMDLQSKLAIGLMNLKIKTYGKMEILNENLKIGSKERQTPLKYFGKNELAPLKIASCTMCHNDQFWGRGSLTRQQALPIKHLIQKRQMPPWPFSLSKSEKNQIELYLQGF